MFQSQPSPSPYLTFANPYTFGVGSAHDYNYAASPTHTGDTIDAGPGGSPYTDGGVVEMAAGPGEAGLSSNAGCGGAPAATLLYSGSAAINISGGALVGQPPTQQQHQQQQPQQQHRQARPSQQQAVFPLQISNPHQSLPPQRAHSLAHTGPPPHAPPSFRHNSLPFGFNPGVRVGAGVGPGSGAHSAPRHTPPHSGPGSASASVSASASSGSGPVPATASATTTARLGLHHHPLSHAHSPSSLHAQVASMEGNHDISAQEMAAAEYQPDLQGPQVGKKMSSHAITEEYARADPIYVEKTINLPNTYSHYRPIQGDGNCGWRAIAFGYFETLIQINNLAKVQTEHQRLLGLNDFIKNVGGIDPFIFEDMADETFTLLDRIATALPRQDDAMSILEETFNTPDISAAILYHFRLLASSHFKGNVASYEPFLTDDTPAKYSTATLECPGVEIDNLGLVLLTNVLLKPAGIMLEVAILDRSGSSHVNTYRLPEEAVGCDTTTFSVIYTLFRPTHYDLLYLRPTDIQVNHAVQFSQNHNIIAAPGMETYSHMNMTGLSVLPTFGGAAGGSLFMVPDGASPMDVFAPSPQSTWMPSPYAEELPAPPTQIQVQHSQPSTPQSVGPRGLRVSPIAEVPIDSHPLRMTKYCQMPEFVENDTWRGTDTLTTPTFKNSHFNKAHYNNPDFQPEVYNPEADDSERVDLPSRRKKGSMS